MWRMTFNARYTICLGIHVFAIGTVTANMCIETGRQAALTLTVSGMELTVLRNEQKNFRTK